MNIASIIINLASISLGLGTAGSLMIHDTNVDKALLTAVTNHVGTTSPVVAISKDPHTHSERGSLHQAIRDLNASQPRVQPRNQNDKKYAQTKPTRGHHPFDNYSFPAID